MHNIFHSQQKNTLTEISFPHSINPTPDTDKMTEGDKLGKDRADLARGGLRTGGADGREWDGFGRAGDQGHDLLLQEEATESGWAMQEKMSGSQGV